jgi:thioredoxin-like negative regulator of GroEL
MAGNRCVVYAGPRTVKIENRDYPKLVDPFRSIPALLVFVGGREVDRIVGVQPKSEIAGRLRRFAS